VLLHKAKSGRLIIRLSQKVEPGWTLVDVKGRTVGRVLELLGPTSGPYASVVPSTSRIGGKKGEKVYVNG
jgi:rRNA processing protein Gar1